MSRWDGSSKPPSLLSTTAKSRRCDKPDTADVERGDRAEVDYERLFKLRLVVARVGEMDLAGWWNTKGQLGSLGTSVVQRGFRRTHYFAQARSVFAVASQRASEVYDRRDAVTLWALPAELEDAFSARWVQWIETASDWRSFFEALDGCTNDLLSEVRRFGLGSEDQLQRASHLRRSAEQRAVRIPGYFAGSDDDITMLSLGFSRGERQNLAVPFQPLGGRP